MDSNQAHDDNAQRLIEERALDFYVALVAGDNPSKHEYVSDTREPTRTLLWKRLHEIEAQLQDGGFPPQPEGAHLAQTASIAPPSADESSILPSGGLIGGRYQLIGDPLGSGGQGCVWRARDTTLGREVALKILFGIEERHRATLYKEAETIAKLDHENIVYIHNLGDERGKLLYIDYELIEGHDLHKEVESQLPSCVQAAQWCRDIARGIHHCHEGGVIHRDLKPKNVMLRTADRQIKIVDFGLAKRTHSENSDEQSVDFKGTVAWTSPEQLECVATKLSDVHAIGSILYFLLTGQRPFDGSRESRERPPSIRDRFPEVPEALERICLQALNFKPENRQASAEELANQLESFLQQPEAVDVSPQTVQRTEPTAPTFLLQPASGQSGQVSPVSATATRGRWEMRQMVGSISLITLSLLAMSGLMAYFIGGGPYRRPERSDGWRTVSANDLRVLIGPEDAILGPPSWDLFNSNSFQIQPDGMVLVTFPDALCNRENRLLRSFNIELEMKLPTTDCVAGLFLGSRESIKGMTQQHFLCVERSNDDEHHQIGIPSRLVLSHGLPNINLPYSVNLPENSFGNEPGPDGYKQPEPIPHLDRNKWIRISLTVEANHVTKLMIDDHDVGGVIKDNLLAQWPICEEKEVKSGFGVFVFGPKSEPPVFQKVKYQIRY